MDARSDGGRVGRRLTTRLVAGATVLAAAVTAAVVIHGCGGGGDEGARSQAAEPQASVAAAPEAPYSGAADEVVTASTTRVEADGSGGGLPPEIAIEDMNTSVVPGQAITIRVQGTPDVTEMLLSDGLGDTQALARDASGDGTWRVDYRVPLRPREERLGLSVTARNEAKRWRRVWVFLQVQPPAHVVQVEPDSSEAR